MDFRLIFDVMRKNWSTASWWTETVFPYARSVALQTAFKPYYALTADSGTDFMNEDWDNLLILDACRYDMFDRLNWISGELRKQTSLASSTPEFLKKTFRGKEFHDVVYVTANPQVSLRLDENIFHDVIHVWNTHWDDELETVHPDSVAEVAKDAHDRYPNKRLLVHFMQPHYPFIGEKARTEIGDHAGFELTKRIASDEDATRDQKTVWDMLKAGNVSESAVWNAYDENLKLALESVEKLLDAFEEKTVISSDHGNLFGKRVFPFPIQLYGHPTGFREPNLINVPWFIQEGQRRKHVTSEDPETTATDYNEDQIRNHLEDLGYS